MPKMSALKITTKRRERTPTPPGRYIAEDILGEFGLNQGELATALGVSRRTVNQLVQGRRGVTAAIALRLARLTGTSAAFWVNLQTAVDLWEAERREAEALKSIRPLSRRAA